ncbi:MAG: type IV secretion system DNA-binding domain-containing protein [Candidatus Moranbacteria bacterium]|nr:type IV secretion system DNA-binding domain-containing protein [Candidatus Moranbacteria bacterium]
MSEVIAFAKTNFRNKEATFGIKTDDRRRHFYAIGKTGMGKTNLLENMAIQDIRNGHGVAFVDPHGDTAEKLISMIPSDRLDDVIYFNPADQDFPLAFNVMEKVAPEFRPLVASGLIGVFQKLWADSWGPRLEYILRNALLALLEYPGSNLLGVMRILVDKNYRKRVSSKITDPVVRSFWVDEFPQWNERVLQEVISPIQNKVGQFLTSPVIRNVVGQNKSAFDLRTIMDDKKILIMNLSKGRIGEDNSALIGAMIITKIQLAAMGRVDTPEEDRKDFYLYVDEFQNFATESFANILSEARKYRLNLILANQYITQLDETVRDAIFGNAGTIVSFRVGAFDAEFLEKEFEPVFMMNDIVNLPKYNIYLKLMIDGIAGDAFSATTLPPIERLESDSTEQIIQLSREKYATPRKEVEEKIARSSGMLSEDDLASSREDRQYSSSRVKETRDFSRNSKPKKFTPKFSKPQVSERKVYEKPKVVSRQTPNDNSNSNFSEKRRDLREERKTEVQKPKRQFYPVNCDTCDEAIEIPFKPDGKRPVFCKDCLKDYQRAVAKVKETKNQDQNDDVKKGDSRKGQGENTGDNLNQNEEVKENVYVSKDKPLNFSQMQHMEPKKFSNSKKEIDFAGVRDMIKQVEKE